VEVKNLCAAIPPLFFSASNTQCPEWGSRATLPSPLRLLLAQSLTWWICADDNNQYAVYFYFWTW
jgi:hypothetical protein